MLQGNVHWPMHIFRPTITPEFSSSSLINWIDLLDSFCFSINWVKLLKLMFWHSEYLLSWPKCEEIFLLLPDSLLVNGRLLFSLLGLSKESESFNAFVVSFLLKNYWEVFKVFEVFKWIFSLLLFSGLFFFIPKAFYTMFEVFSARYLFCKRFTDEVFFILFKSVNVSYYFTLAFAFPFDDS